MELEMTHNYYQDAGEKLIQTIRAAFASMDDAIYQMEIVKTNMERGMHTDKAVPEGLYSNDETERTEALEIINKGRWGMASLNAALFNLQTKAYQLTDMNAALIAANNAYDQTLQAVAEPFLPEPKQFTAEEIDMITTQIQEGAKRLCQG